MSRAPHVGSLIRLLSSFAGRHVVVLGDAMLDRLVTGEVCRISPEAPVPVLRREQMSSALGGAANVARNVVRLGGHATLVALVGADAAGAALTRLGEQEPGLVLRLVIDPDRCTTEKRRYVAGSQHLLRVDTEDDHPASDAIEGDIVRQVAAALPGAAALVLSDYAKGALTPAVVKEVTTAARQFDVQVIADPKPNTVRLYRGADVVTPNASEASAITGIDASDDDGAARAARAVSELTQGASVVLTRGSRGMTVLTAPNSLLHLPTSAREVFDVSGAGDTVVAVLALSGGGTLADAAHLANTAAGIAVSCIGTTAVSREAVQRALVRQAAWRDTDKIMSLAQAVDLTARWRAAGERVVLTNGCFDLLHPGHLHLLHAARALGNRLIVALNDDASVRRLKGAGRPIQHDTDRAALLARLGGVDSVILFGEDTPLAVIEALRPSVLVKGSDYTLDTVVGAEFVKAYGGDVALVPLLEGHSTTRTLLRLTDCTETLL